MRYPLAAHGSAISDQCVASSARYEADVTEKSQNRSSQGLNPSRNSALICAVPTHRTVQENGFTLDVLESADLRIIVNRLGAELISIARRDAAGTWHGFLYRDGLSGKPESGWGNHATVMGYFLHRLWQEQSNYRGAIIRGGNHGFLRHFQFDAPEVADSRLTYRVAADRVPPEAYPLKVSLALSYTLSEEGVRVQFDFHNEEPATDAHLSFGLHPGFAVSSVDAARILLPPGDYVRHFAPGNFLDGETEDIHFRGGEMPFSKKLLPDSYLLGLDKLPSRLITLEDDALNHRVVLDFSEVPFLTLWSEMNSYLCIEPCWGLPDNNPPKPFEQKVGIQHIPAGGTLSCGFAINPSFLK